MSERTAKAIATRTRRLSAAFQAEQGREPTVDELNELYRAEMREIASKSSRNKHGKAYFAQLKESDPDALKNISSKGGQIGGKISKRGPSEV